LILSEKLQRIGEREEASLKAIPPKISYPPSKLLILLSSKDI
jgi:hypothetical protein